MPGTDMKAFHAGGFLISARYAIIVSGYLRKKQLSKYIQLFLWNKIKARQK
jgi:hypothetical protein